MRKKKIKNKNKLPLGVIIAATVLILLVVFFFINLPEEQIVARFDSADNRWQVGSGTLASPEGEGVRLTKVGPDFFIVFPDLRVDADSNNVCQLEIENPIAYETGRLFFLSQFNPSFDMNFSYEYDSGRGNRFNQIYLNLAKHPAWQGYTGGFLLIPGEGAAWVKLGPIRFIHANILTGARAVWSDFVRYYDPKLGTCFAMASPFFWKEGYNPFFIPYLWGLLILAAVILAAVKIFHFDPRTGEIAIAAFFIAFLLVWFVLDLRNNIYYLKAMRRDAMLYWGKPLEQKRGIVTGDPEFVGFMNFCDEHIPMDGKIFNLVPKELPGTPFQYLSSTQVFFILRPRLESFYHLPGKDPRPYYIVYKNNPQDLKGIDKPKLFKRFNADAYILTD